MNTVLKSIACAAAVLLATTSASAQERPSLAGTWVEVDNALRPPVASRGDGSFRVGDMGSGWASPLTITIEPARVIVSFNPYSAYDLQPVVHFTYPLDGSEARNQESLGFAETNFTSRSAWHGAALIATDRVPVPPEVAGRGVTAEVQRRLTIASDTLVIETTRVGVAGAPTRTSRSTYTRTP